MKRSTRGFTLIELLVVIAIIGILASVVLVSLQSARKKGNDTRVISGIQQLRTQLESDFNGSAYPLTSANTWPSASNYTTLVSDITAQSAAPSIKSSSPYSNYAIYAPLVSDTTKAFCMDSTGIATTTSQASTSWDATCN